MKIKIGIPYRIATFALLNLVASVLVSRAELVSINSITNNADTVGVFFDVPVTLPSATNPANYSVYTKTGAVSIAGVSIQTNSQFVALTLLNNVREFFYVDVTNITDSVSNVITAKAIGYISEYGSSDVGTLGDPNPAGEVFTALKDTFDITVGGSDIGGTNDHFRFVYREVTGDFDMAVNVARLDAVDSSSKAGLMARETLAADSKTIQTYFTPPSGANEVEVAMRATTGGSTTDSGFQIGPRATASSNSWLRLQRAGNFFIASHGTNGRDWTISGSTTQALNTTLKIGMAVASHTNGMSTTASFTDFGTVGVRPGDEILPTLSAALSGSDLALNWPDTPHDYSVAISTNLFDWSLMLAPIFETGTNGTGRLMLLPLDQFESPLFARLVPVDRLIPDPPLALVTGLIISLANGNVTTANDTLLCTYPITNAITQTSMTAVPNVLVTFSTADSGSSLDTVLKVRRFPDLTQPCNDNSAGNLKSLMATNTTATKTNFSLVSGVKIGTPPVTATQKIKVSITIQ